MPDLKKADFHISVKPVSVEFTCPYCGKEIKVPWNQMPVPEYWGDDWGTFECPECLKEIKLEDYDYD